MKTDGLDRSIPRGNCKPKPLQSRLLATIGGAAAVTAYALWVRPWHLRWGATEEELRMPFPGQNSEATPERVLATHAVTIQAPVAEVWVWLVQIGQDRAGFYSYSWLENLVGCQLRNADRIVPEWQDLQVGDSVRLHPKAPSLPVTYLEPERALILADGWGFLLREVDPHTTRLIARGWGDAIPDLHNPLLHFLYWRVFFEPVHFLMERKMLLGIRHRAEEVRGSHR